MTYVIETTKGLLRVTALLVIGASLMAVLLSKADQHDDQSISVPYKALMAMERK